MAYSSSRIASPLRQQRIRIFDHWYEPKGRVGDPCAYCGQVSDTMDHVPPLSFVATLPDVDMAQMDARKVPACRECNAALGSRLLLRIRERREFIREWLQHRYARILRMPTWDEEDLSEMCAPMRESIEAHMVFKRHVEARLARARG